MTDAETNQLLASLNDILNDAVDKLAANRQANSTYLNRYVTKKVEKALWNIHAAQEKVENNKNIG